METILKVVGMSCEHCERHTKNALEEIAGVQSAVASHSDGQVVIQHDAAVSILEMKEAIVEVGYEVVS